NEQFFGGTVGVTKCSGVRSCRRRSIAVLVISAATSGNSGLAGIAQKAADEAAQDIAQCPFAGGHAVKVCYSRLSPQSFWIYLGTRIPLCCSGCKCSRNCTSKTEITVCPTCLGIICIEGVITPSAIIPSVIQVGSSPFHLIITSVICSQRRFYHIQ